MITSGPHSAASNATSVQPNAFDVAPNVLRLLGKSFCCQWFFWSIASYLSLRLLKAGKNKKEANIYIQNARRQITYDSAARAWALGVPWAEALGAARKAVAAGNAAAKLNRLPFAKGKGKNAKGKAKGQGKGKR